MSSSANKFIASKGANNQDPEESGWTQYLEEFSWEQRENRVYSNDEDDDSFGSPSLVSDAASPVNDGAWNFSGNRKGFASATIGATAPQFSKRLNMKKQKYKGRSCDDLEDTASSPVNSPKVKDGVSDQFSQQKANERSKINLDREKIEYEEDLKKRGLCLMPFSMLVHYMG